MNHTRFSFIRLGFVALWLFLLNLCGASAVQAGELKFEATLVWGTDDEKSPNPEHKQVEAKVEKKLKKLFKWKHYFEVTRKPFSLKDGETRKISLSKECEIKVHSVSKDTVELHIYGKGECVGKISQALPKGELLVTGGSAANFTGWFVVLRQVE